MILDLLIICSNLAFATLIIESNWGQKMNILTCKRLGRDANTKICMSSLPSLLQVRIFIFCPQFDSIIQVANAKFEHIIKRSKMRIKSIRKDDRVGG